MAYDPRNPQPWQGQPPQQPQGWPPNQGQQHYPPQPYYGQPYPPPQYQAAPYPRQAVSQQGMSYSESIFHWTMIFITCGMWIPVYLSARRKRRTVTTFR